MMLVLNKGDTTHHIPNVDLYKVISDEVIAVFVSGRHRAVGVKLDEWDALYLLHERVVTNNGNLEWLKEPNGQAR